MIPNHVSRAKKDPVVEEQLREDRFDLFFRRLKSLLPSGSIETEETEGTDPDGSTCPVLGRHGSDASAAGDMKVVSSQNTSFADGPSVFQRATSVTTRSGYRGQGAGDNRELFWDPEPAVARIDSAKEPVFQKIPDDALHVSFLSGGGQFDVVVKGPSSFLVAPGPEESDSKVEILCACIGTSDPSGSTLSSKYKSSIEDELQILKYEYRRGVRTALYNHVEDWAKERGIQNTLIYCG